MLKEPRAFKVSDEDRDLLEGGWSVRPDGYVFRKIPHPDGGGRGRSLYLHRLIAARMIGRELQRGEDVDHLDHNPSNNGRENLQVRPHRENVTRRRALQTNNTSGHRGVSRINKTGNWEAYIKIRGRKKNLGHFPTKEQAAAAYLAAATREFGEFLGATS